MELALEERTPADGRKRRGPPPESERGSLTDGSLVGEIPGRLLLWRLSVEQSLHHPGPLWESCSAVVGPRPNSALAHCRARRLRAGGGGSTARSGQQESGRGSRQLSSRRPLGSWIAVAPRPTSAAAHIDSRRQRTRKGGGPR